ncbi:MAG TPA: hypothetical protein VHI54_09255 [Actinomycetota bacterium]|nr:hypothetical protein [Actinomycetota bacterium]
MAAMVLALAAPAFAARSADLKPGQAFEWQVRGFKTPTATPTACPPSIDREDVLCDHVFIRVEPVDYSRSTGSLNISIAFSSASNFNLYVFKSSELVRSSEGSSGGTESITIPNPTGVYEVRVVPVQIAGSLLSGLSGGAAYAGRAVFAAQSVPAAVQQQPSGSTNVGLPSSTPRPSGSNRSFSPRYKIPSSGNYYAGYPAYGGSFNPGGLYQGPEYSGGGTTQFSTEAGAGTPYYQSAYGGPVNGGVPQKVAESTRDVAVGSAVARAPKALWLLLPLALLLLGGVAYLVVEPEGRAEAVAAGESDSYEVPSRVALGGVFLKSLAGIGRALRLAQRWVASLRSTSE